jgi:lipopolysaccharide transport system permease protein
MTPSESRGPSGLPDKRLTTITPRGGWLDFDLREVWDAQELIGRFVHRDFIASYKQTVLGPLWFVVPPIATTLIFTIVFGRIAEIPTNGAPDFLFFMISVVFWNFFASCLSRSSNTFTGNAGLFGKVYIPRLTIPISLIISNLISLAIQIVIFVAFYVWYAWRGATIVPTWWMLSLPLLLLQLAILGLGLGCIVSALTTYYRDFAMILGFGIQLWMYASCVVFPLSAVNPNWQWLVALNPIVPILETTRYACFGVGTPYPQFLAISVAMTLASLFVGLVFFKRMERTFMDTV